MNVMLGDATIDFQRGTGGRSSLCCDCRALMSGMPRLQDVMHFHIPKHAFVVRLNMEVAFRLSDTSELALMQVNGPRNA